MAESALAWGSQFSKRNTAPAQTGDSPLQWGSQFSSRAQQPATIPDNLDGEGLAQMLPYGLGGLMEPAAPLIPVTASGY
ncbi:MAG: hypothetical protein ACYSUX_13945, partial [Planctomycetota bacterium]